MLEFSSQGMLSDIFTFRYNFNFSALGSIGVKGYDQHPAGADINKITVDVFSREA